MPELQQLADEYRDRGVELVTVVMNGSAQRARGVAARVGLRAPVLLSGPELTRAYHVDAVPWTVIVGRDGKAVSALRGGQSKATFQKLIDARL